ncbi:hypothetical protein EGN72_07190 [Pseudorhodobacter sp. E13]|uniref:restriction endonuclease subunit S n=1 Tax=Pseudorhodobacter sp. E13 TaxID=2487931 RepID=UPI000F8F5F47|nr:restriction endonuclease subunit S [Pseudorhodobacter sp. E13]RUS60686.1 hypothetical protein EGN72_07190 [Pseudorhodobacter sp. E13]
MITSIALGDAFEHIRNGMSVKQDKDADGIPITRIETISDGTIDLGRVGYAGLQHTDVEKWLLQPGDILLSHINSVEHIGKCALFEDPTTKLVHGMNLLSMRPKSDILFPRYAMWAMKDPSFKARILKFVNKAVNQASISTTNLKTVEIPLPPLEEQKRIAGILDQADALRRLRTRALDKLNTLGQAIFYEMFAPQIESQDLSGFITIEYACREKLQNGAYFPRESYSEVGVEMVHMGDAFAGTVSRGCLKRVKCSETDLNKYSLVSSDLLIARRSLNFSGAAKPCMIPPSFEPMIFESSFIRIRPNPAVTDALFLFYYLQDPIARGRFVLPNITQSTISGISQSNLKKVLLPKIAAADRSVFRDRHDELLGQIQKQERLVERQNSLFSSLQHRAFRGEL